MDGNLTQKATVDRTIFQSLDDIIGYHQKNCASFAMRNDSLGYAGAGDTINPYGYIRVSTRE